MLHVVEQAFPKKIQHTRTRNTIDYLDRKLGLVENLFEILHDLGAMIVLNVARIQGALTPHLLQQALNFVQKRHIRHKLKV